MLFWLMRSLTKSLVCRGVIGLVSLNLMWELAFCTGAPSAVVVDVILRGVLVVYLLAFWSVHVQAPGLSGEMGLFPLQTQLQSLEMWVSHASNQHNPLSLLLTRTTLLLLSPQSLATLSRTCLYVALAGLLYPHFLVFLYLYLCYFATRRVLPQMLNLQWDALLLESGAYAAVLALSIYPHSLALSTSPLVRACLGLASSLAPPAGSPPLQLLTQRAALLPFKLLVFRLFFGSGLVKLTSGDRHWRGGTALFYHFQTQPLPTPLAPWLHRLPRALLRVMCRAVLALEMLVPLLALAMPPVLGPLAAALFALLQLSIMAAGRFGFFNLLSLVLCCSLCEDWALPFPLAPVAASAPAVAAAAGAALGHPMLLALRLLLLTLCLSLVLGHVAAVYALLTRCGMASPEPTSRPVTPWGFVTYVHGVLLSASLCGHYGLFASMTTVRDEVEVEVSRGDDNWTPIEWQSKPSVHTAGGGLRFLSFPPFHMPRVDWRLWFVSLNLARELRDARFEATGSDGNAVKTTTSAITSTTNNEGKAAPAALAPVGSAPAAAALSAPAASPPAHLPVWLNVLLIGILERHAGILALLGPNSRLRAGPSCAQERVRVRLVRYVFSPAGEGANRAPSSPAAAPWEPSYSRMVLPATSLEDLYVLSAAGASTHSLYGRKQAMQPDTAADIIARTFQRSKSKGD